MMKNLSAKNPKKKSTGRRFGQELVSLVLCVSILISAVPFALNAIALTIHTEAPEADAVPADAEGSQLIDACVIPCVITGEDGSQEEAALIVTAVKNSDLAPAGAGEYAEQLTNRSNDIGVVSEGYTDSPYTVDKTEHSLSLTDTEQNTGGTIRVTNRMALLTYDHALYDQQLWDGKKPFRITAAGGLEGYELRFTLNDFDLEDDAVPYGALKIDNLSLAYSGLESAKNFFARGNKFVIGENVTTQNSKDWNIYGGAKTDRIGYNGEPQDVLTNVVVASGSWDYVFGGGRVSTGRGTQVTIRGNANVTNVYGGGEYDGKVGIQDENNDDREGVNVYIEGGTVGNLWGGNRINHYENLLGLVTRYPLPIFEDINITVSGGTVSRLIAGSDCTDSNTNTNDNLNESAISGNATVNITGGSVGSVAGDPNRKSLTDHQIQGDTVLNVSASNSFTYFDLFDVVNITGDGSTVNGVVVSTDSKAGDSFTDANLTFWGGENREGYIGQISVTNGAKLVLTKGGTINKEENAGTGSWIGETDETDRSWSTLAISGSGSAISAAPGASFTDGTNVCGLRVHGEVQGYSTLEVTGTPIYSDANDYYYYIVADSSVNGGKAFKGPDDADYIVCYRYLEGGKIGWYLRERPSIAMNNKIVRTGDNANGSMVMSVTMNTFGCEWSGAEADNNVDFTITKVTGTNSASLTTATDSISCAAMAGIKTDSSGRFSNVVTATDPTSRVEYLVSFDYIVDSSTPVDPTYYTLEADYHVVRDNGSYDDVHFAGNADAARVVYDFAGSDELHSSGGYDDSIMTTFPYGSSPAGADTALLRVYMPLDAGGNQVTGTLTVAENDGHFRFTTDTSIDAQLDSSTTVASDYAAAAGTYADSHFGVTIGGSELSSGVSKTLSTAVSEYICTVYSYKNLSIYDISQLTSGGLQLNLTVSGLTKGGEAVGTGSPTAVNNGELQIQTAGTYKITYRFTTRTQGVQVFVVKGNLGEASVDANGHLTSGFVLSKAPYESNHGQNLSWDSANIIHSYTNGVLSADLTATQGSRMVSLNYRTTSVGAYTTVYLPVGANRNSNSSVANIITTDESFKYWEIRKSGENTAPVYARCYDAEFSYCIMDDYWISPVFESSSGDKTARLNPDALKNCDEDWLAWTYNEGESGTLVFPNDDLTFNGLKNKVNFVRVPHGTTTLGTNWSNVWNQSQDLDVQDGKTYVLTSYSQTYGDKTMYGNWSDTITLTHTEYTRNRWTDSEGNLSANGRSDYLYSDFEISFKDGAPNELNESEGYRTGVVFELCGSLGDGAAFDPDTYKYRSDTANLKAAIVNRSSSYSTDGSTRRIQCNDISTSALTNMNRIELGKSYYNTATNSRAIMKVTAYLVDGNNNVTLSNPVYICLYDTSLMNLAISSD